MYQYIYSSNMWRLNCLFSKNKIRNKKTEPKAFIIFKEHAYCNIMLHSIYERCFFYKTYLFIYMHILLMLWKILYWLYLIKKNNTQVYCCLSQCTYHIYQLKMFFYFGNMICNDAKCAVHFEEAVIKNKNLITNWQDHHRLENVCFFCIFFL